MAASTSLWSDTLDAHAETDGRLDGSTHADVVIVGAGYTGLWTAYHLSVQRPDMRIVVLEASTVGFGASGRNGGWCSALMPMSLTALAHDHGHGAAVDMQRAMYDTVADVRRIADDEGIDCQASDGGYVMLARSRPQLASVHAHLAEMASFGFGDDDHRWLGAAEARERVGASDVLGAAYTPHCSALHPARLVHGLATAVRRRGVVIHDGTPVTEIESHRVRTPRGSVTAPVVVRATEAWTSRLAGHRRDVLPIYSLMIATEPLGDDVWATIGLHDRPTFNDTRSLIVYGQRTADGRLAFGGRGAPYHFGSAIDPRFDVDDAVHDSLRRALVQMFPVLSDVDITHRWGGPLGVPRDWHASVGFDPRTGMAWGGGYVGDGVATAHLAGRTIADLVLGVDSPLVRLPWVGHRSPRWEPEPLRWLAVRSALGLPASIDRHEERTGRPARLRSAVLGLLTGH